MYKLPLWLQQRFSVRQSAGFGVLQVMFESLIQMTVITLGNIYFSSLISCLDEWFLPHQIQSVDREHLSAKDLIVGQMQVKTELDELKCPQSPINKHVLKHLCSRSGNLYIISRTWQRCDYSLFWTLVLVSFGSRSNLSSVRKLILL